MKVKRYEAPCKHCSGKGYIEAYDPESLRKVRLHKGFTLRGMAREIGLSAAFLSDVELGRRNPNEAIINFLNK